MNTVISTLKKTRIMSFEIKLLNAKAKIPTRGSPMSAGYDLYASEDVTIAANGRGIVKTGISVAAEQRPYKISLAGGALTTAPNSSYNVQMYFRLAPRSGLAVKNGINVGAGVVDADYRGEIGVVLFNHSNEDFKVAVGDRIAQMIPELMMHPAGEPFKIVDELSTTQRGDGGFGSTGK